MNQQDYLITLNVPPALEEAVVDCLLGFENAQGFSSFAINAHDHRHLGLSLAEQVSGRQRKIRFQMYVARDNVTDLLAQLREEFSGAGLRYWVMPIIEQGEI